MSAAGGSQRAVEFFDVLTAMSREVIAALRRSVAAPGSPAA